MLLTCLKAFHNMLGELLAAESMKISKLNLRQLTIFNCIKIIQLINF